MANFTDMRTTTKGHELLIDVLAGKLDLSSQTPFTRIVTSPTVYTLAEIEQLETIEDIRQETLVSAVTKVNQTTVEVHGGLENAQLRVGYRLNTVGVYFREPSTGEEFLFGGAIHDPTEEEPNAAFIFSFNGITSTALMFNLITSIGNADNLPRNIDSAAYVTHRTLLLHNQDPNAHAGQFAHTQKQIDELKALTAELRALIENGIVINPPSVEPPPVQPPLEGTVEIEVDGNPDNLSLKIRATGEIVPLNFLARNPQGFATFKGKEVEAVDSEGNSLGKVKIDEQGRLTNG